MLENIFPNLVQGAEVADGDHLVFLRDRAVAEGLAQGLEIALSGQTIPLERIGPGKLPGAQVGDAYVAFESLPGSRAFPMGRKLMVRVLRDSAGGIRYQVAERPVVGTGEDNFPIFGPSRGNDSPRRLFARFGRHVPSRYHFALWLLFGQSVVVNEVDAPPYPLPARDLLSIEEAEEVFLGSRAQQRAIRGGRGISAGRAAYRKTVAELRAKRAAAAKAAAAEAVAVAETPEVEISEAETPVVEAPEVEAPEVEVGTPEAEAPKFAVALEPEHLLQDGDTGPAKPKRARKGRAGKQAE